MSEHLFYMVQLIQVKQRVLMNYLRKYAITF